MNLEHKPTKLTKAINLLIVSIIIGIINFFIANFDTIDLTKIATVILTFLFMSVFVYLINARKKWARTVFLILFLLGSLMFPFTVATLFEQNPIAAIISVVLTIIQIFALVLLYSEEVNNWINYRTTSP
ncbi:hypothetical protein [Flavobacterium sp. UBA7663]|uniref:hypothetical protein n=1 Tax=Flavobacterium sp. UBA7663 TaxID=1946557 RepID=UPI0025C1FA01|nr:hypothetical protein [Flavobacterium sp. UBA7663]